MENPTARETTHATSPAPYPMTVASSTSVAWAAKGAMAVAKAATAAAFFSSLTTNSLFIGALLMESADLATGRVAGAKPETHATAATKRRRIC